MVVKIEFHSMFHHFVFHIYMYMVYLILYIQLYYKSWLYQEKSDIHAIVVKFKDADLGPIWDYDHPASTPIATNHHK